MHEGSAAAAAMERIDHLPLYSQGKRILQFLFLFSIFVNWVVYSAMLRCFPRCRLREACDCGFLYWHRVVFPTYLADICENSSEPFRLHVRIRLCLLFSGFFIYRSVKLLWAYIARCYINTKIHVCIHTYIHDAM